ncbi:TIGR03560 family F420-dependent LLM class oxidoreductase [Agromyces sp. CFH 90414]|uniref:TIGR03560 family F420-dependent LLM class oxidoreductase n=1 Tax=Agromyces agglutinans TaxID=2662258 RepID=A0A6I2FEA3_9MICO|nr:TIGR03560 family F420-dependent LLM class oxidoreductase [Agromyces agglutinans]MRG59418.1 TIGR03560 family F420-dependent LLM class oxidoreductase [Agromyces agglutinans]
MRFGMFVPQGWRHDLVGFDPGEEWAVMRSIAQRADRADSPWESIWVYDHFHTVPVPSDTESTHEAWALMAAFAASTERVRLGQMCTCMAYRNPAYLAKAATTVDHVSGGRLEMGIGAGWYEHEWRAFGYGFPDAPERLRMLREGVEILHQAWATGTATFHGEHYDVDGAIFRPLPIQEGGIPMWVAGGGEKVTLRIAAKYASYTNFFGSLDEFSHKSEVLRGHCERVDRDFASITRSSNFNTVIGTDAADVERRLAAIEARLAPYLGPDATARYMADLHSPAVLVGTVGEVTAKLADAKERGLGYAISYFPEAAYDLSGIELYEREVIPALA